MNRYPTWSTPPSPPQSKDIMSPAALCRMNLAADNHHLIRPVMVQLVRVVPLRMKSSSPAYWEMPSLLKDSDGPEFASVLYIDRCCRMDVASELISTELLLPELLMSGVAYGRSGVDASISDVLHGLSDSKESISDINASVSLPDSGLLTESVFAVSSEFCSLSYESDIAVRRETPGVSPALWQCCFVHVFSPLYLIGFSVLYLSLQTRKKSSSPCKKQEKAGMIVLITQRFPPLLVLYYRDPVCRAKLQKRFPELTLLFYNLLLSRLISFSSYDFRIPFIGFHPHIFALQIK